MERGDESNKVNFFCIGVPLIGRRILRVCRICAKRFHEIRGFFMVKRIAAIPGETIMGKTEYISQNCYYVIGDNALYECDARCWHVWHNENRSVLCTYIA